MVNDFVLYFLGYVFIQEIVPGRTLELGFWHKIVEVPQIRGSRFERGSVPLEDAIEAVRNDLFINFVAAFSFDDIQNPGVAMDPLGS